MTKKINVLTLVFEKNISERKKTHNAYIVEKQQILIS
jgi:hypothetical protein